MLNLVYVIRSKCIFIPLWTNEWIVANSFTDLSRSIRHFLAMHVTVLLVELWSFYKKLALYYPPLILPHLIHKVQVAWNEMSRADIDLSFHRSLDLYKSQQIFFIAFYEYLLRLLLFCATRIASVSLHLILFQLWAANYHSTYSVSFRQSAWQTLVT